MLSSLKDDLSQASLMHSARAQVACKKLQAHQEVAGICLRVEVVEERFLRSFGRKEARQIPESNAEES